MGILKTPQPLFEKIMQEKTKKVQKPLFLPRSKKFKETQKKSKKNLKCDETEEKHRI